MVMLLNNRKISRKGDKLDQIWTGPYIINEYYGKGVYRLEGLVSKISASRLKRF